MNFPNIKHKKSAVIMASVLLFSLFLSLSVFLVKKNGTRRIFIFPSVESGSFVVETRHLKKSHNSPLEYYVNELMLGPQTERTRSVFPKDTKILSIIQKNRIVYINLSKDVINPETEHKMLPLRDSINLLKKNIKKNFPSVSEIHVFVEGNYAFDNN